MLSFLSDPVSYSIRKEIHFADVKLKSIYLRAIFHKVDLQALTCTTPTENSEGGRLL